MLTGPSKCKKGHTCTKPYVYHCMCIFVCMCSIYCICPVQWGHNNPNFGMTLISLLKILFTSI